MNRRNLLLAGFALFVLCTSGPGDAGSSGIGGLGKPCWALADLAVVLALLRGVRLWPIVRDNLWLSGWPALAVLSAAWSLMPGISAYHGAQLAMTLLVGYLAVAALDYADLLLALSLGLAAGQALSALAILRHAPGAVAPDGTLLGAYPHKNLLGAMMSLQVLTCCVLVLDGRHRLFAAAAGLSAVVLLVGSRSGTSMLSLAVVLSLLPLAWSYGRSKTLFGFAMGLSTAAAGAIALLLVGGGDIVGSLLGSLGKDDTMSGRTLLWQFGLDQINASPLVGIGFQAYWDSPDTSAAYLRYVIGQDLWFFHNNFVDVGVAFGWLGLAVFAAGLLASAWRVLVMFDADPRVLVSWRILFVVYVIVEATAENPLFQNHSLSQALLAAATAWPAAARVLRPTRARPSSLVPAEICR